MQTSAQIAAEARETFTLFMERHRMRKTPERYAILRRVCDMQANFSVDDLYDAMESSSYHVSKATIYNSLKVLCDAGIVKPNLHGKQFRYELAVKGTIKLVCLSCGKVKEVADDALRNFLIDQRFPAFAPSYASMSVYGRCAKCQRRSKRALSTRTKLSRNNKLIQTNK